jgi:hypothetical protein
MSYPYDPTIDAVFGVPVADVERAFTADVPGPSRGAIRLTSTPPAGQQSMSSAIWIAFQETYDLAKPGQTPPGPDGGMVFYDRDDPTATANHRHLTLLGRSLVQQLAWRDYGVTEIWSDQPNDLWRLQIVPGSQPGTLSNRLRQIGQFLADTFNSSAVVTIDD